MHTQVHVLWCQKYFGRVYAFYTCQTSINMPHQPDNTPKTENLVVENCMYFDQTTCTCVSNYMYLCKLHVLWVQKKKFFSEGSDPCYSHNYDWDTGKHPQKSKTWRSENWPNYMYFDQTTCTCANYMYFGSEKKSFLLGVSIVVPVITMTETSENTLRSPKLDGQKIDPQVHVLWRT
jgi:hypothetical protein